MSTDYHCQIHGLVLASEVELPLPRIEPRQADVKYRIELGGSWLPSPSDNPTADPIVHRIGQRLAIEFPGWATFEISRLEVVLLTAEINDHDLIAHLVLAHVVPYVVALRGDLMLHASGAVGPSGRAHLFLGTSGSGKSTLVGALSGAGWPLLDDDAVRIIVEEGRPCAVPGGAGLRLLPDAAGAVIPGVEPSGPLWAGHQKCRFPVSGNTLHMASKPAPIAGLYLLERGDLATLSVERVGFAQAVARIVEHGFHMAAEPDSIPRDAFERASALAAAEPVWRLSHPAGLSHLSATRTLIAELDSND